MSNSLSCAVISISHGKIQVVVTTSRVLPKVKSSGSAYKGTLGIGIGRRRLLL
jgi:hypothetical protein